MHDVDAFPADARSTSDPLSTPDKTVVDCATFVESVVVSADADGVVIPLDGSPAAAFLAIVATRALGPDRVRALSITADARTDDAVEATATLVEELDVPLRHVDLQPMLAEFVARVASTVRERRRSPFETPGTVRVENRPGRDDVRGSLQAVETRLRMAVAYFEANTTRAIVAGPVDRTDWLLGTAPADGRMGADFLPIAHLYHTEVLALGLHVGVPRSVLVGGRTTGPTGRREPDFLSGASDAAVDDALRSLVDEGRPTGEVAADSALDGGVIRRLADHLEESGHRRGRPSTPNSRDRP